MTEQNCLYYMLRNEAMCRNGAEVFPVSLNQSGELAIYDQSPLSFEEVSDLIYYLERKEPYISGVEKLILYIDTYSPRTQERTAYWYGSFPNPSASQQKYDDKHQIKFLV